MHVDSKGIIWAGCGADKIALVRIDYQAINRNLNPPTVLIQNLKVNNESICWYNLQKPKNQKDSLTNLTDSLAVVNEEVLTYGRTIDKAQRDTMRLKFGDIQFDGITRFYPLPENLILPYKHNNVTFEFAAVEPARSYLVKYQYMLEGYDNDWNPVTKKTSASFGNIWEGTYTFKLKACRPNGVWSEPITYTFKVLPPWWRTWWIYFIYIVVFVSTLILIYRWRTAVMRRRQKQLEEEVEMATAEISMQKEEITAQRDKIVEQHNFVSKQKDLIEKIHRGVIDSINYAKLLQSSALPDLNLLKNTFTDIFILFKPKDVVSGDFYWYAAVENQIVITVADCTGHGVPGAFMSMLGISLLKEIVVNEYMTQPDVILRRLRKGVIRALNQSNDSAKQKDGMDLSLCSINKLTFELQWSGAFNPLILVKDGEMIEIKADRMPISIFEKMDRFTLHEMKLKKGDIIYLFSDGYTDQFGGPKSKKFMTKKLKELLLEMAVKPMQEQQKILEKTILDWMNGYDLELEQIDDITVMGIKI